MSTSRPSNRALALFLLFQPWLAVAQQTQQSAEGWSGSWHMGWGLWWIFPLFMFLMMIACVFHFFRRRASGGGRAACACLGTGSSQPGALEILDERLAKGEIEKHEYAEKKAAILTRS